MLTLEPREGTEVADVATKDAKKNHARCEGGTPIW